MGNFTRLRNPGFWVTGSVVDPEEFEQLDAIRTMLINAAEGSTHAPSAPIVIGGAGMQLTGPVQLAGAVTMPNGASLTQNAGAPWALNGNVSIGGSAIVTFGSSTHAAWSGTASIAVDSEWTVYGGMTWQDLNWPKVTSRTVPRCGWRLAYTTFGGTPPASPHAWEQQSDQLGGGSAIRTSTETTTPNEFMVELLDLPNGATLNSVTVTSKGMVGTSGLTRPTYQVVRWRKGEVVGPLTLAAVTDGHEADGSNWTSTTVDTVVSCTALQTIDSGYHYGVRVKAPYQASSGASVMLYDFAPNTTATKIQL